MNISADNIHLAASGKAAHENTGPKAPNPGPTLPIADTTVLIASVSPTPKHISNVQPTKMQIRYVAKKVYTVAELASILVPYLHEPAKRHADEASA